MRKYFQQQPYEKEADIAAIRVTKDYEGAKAFFEAGNAWMDFNEFSPFNLYRSAGVGVRFFLPMVGLIGVDWGYGFDEVPGMGQDAYGSHWHFVLGQEF